MVIEKKGKNASLSEKTSRNILCPGLADAVASPLIRDSEWCEEIVLDKRSVVLVAKGEVVRVHRMELIGECWIVTHMMVAYNDRDTVFWINWHIERSRRFLSANKTSS